MWKAATGRPKNCPSDVAETPTAPCCDIVPAHIVGRPNVETKLPIARPSLHKPLSAGGEWKGAVPESVGSRPLGVAPGKLTRSRTAGTTARRSISSAGEDAFKRPSTLRR